MADEFSWDSGLKEDWDGVVKDSIFIQQDRGNYALQLISLADDGEEVVHRPLSVGGADKGWHSYDGGETIVGATENQKYHARSSVAGFIDAAAKSGAEAELRRRSTGLYGSRGPYHAALWVGLRFHWDVVTVIQQRQNQQTKEWEDTQVQIMVPTRYLGTAEMQQQQLQPQQVQPQQTPPPAQSIQQQIPTTTFQQPATNGGIPEEDLVNLKLLAMEHEEWGAFADAVLSGTATNGESYVKNTTIRANVSKKEWFDQLRA